MLKNHYVFLQNRKKSGTFDENPCRFLKKTTFFFTELTFYDKKKSKQAILLYFTVVFAFLRPKTSRATDFGPGFERLVLAKL